MGVYFEETGTSFKVTFISLSLRAVSPMYAVQHFLHEINDKNEINDDKSSLLFLRYFGPSIILDRIRNFYNFIIRCIIYYII